MNGKPNRWPAASTSNAQFEGDDNATADAATATVRRGNYLQIQVKIPRVTGTQQQIDHAGRGDEMDYQVMLKGLELKRDVESTMLTNQLETRAQPVPRACSVRCSPGSDQHRQRNRRRRRRSNGGRWQHHPC